MDNEKEEIVDARTGEIVPRGAEKEVPTSPPSSLQIHVNMDSLGTIDLTEKAARVLDEPLQENDVRIRPDGLVYLPWTYWNNKLTKAFGRLKWVMIPQGSPQSKETGKDTVLVVWGFWLVVHGMPVSFAMGETSYKTNNKSMSYADAVEGAKSNALTRNCKTLGIANELWDAEWVENWKKNHAHKIKNPNGDYPEYIWVRNDDTRYLKAAKTSKTVKEEVKDTEDNETSQIKSEEISGEIKHKDFYKKENLDAVKEGAQVDTPTALSHINSLDKSGSYTIKQVVEGIMEAKKNQS